MRLRCCSNGLARDSRCTGGGEGGEVLQKLMCSDWFCHPSLFSLSLPSSSAAAARLSDGPECGQIFGEGAADLGRLGCLGPLAQDGLLPQHRDPLQDRWRAVHAGQQQHPTAQERWSLLPASPTSTSLLLVLQPQHPFCPCSRYTQSGLSGFVPKKSNTSDDAHSCLSPSWSPSKRIK